MLDVALHANVAVSTVSHVLNNTAPITEETRQRVMQAVEELNYTPNAMARGLRQEHTNLIGVIVPDIANQFYAECASGVLEATDVAQTVLVCNSGYNRKRERAHVQTLLERRVDGLIFFGGLDDKVLKMAQSKRMPLVLGDRRKQGVRSVTFDNETPLRELMHAIHRSGVRRIGYLSEPINMGNVRKRYEVVSKAAAELDIQLMPEWTIIDESLQLEKLKHTVALMQRLLGEKADQLPEVFITSNDMIALGIINALREQGIRVPQHVGVTGIDNIELAKHTTPALTTINQNPRQLGHTCVSLLMEEIHGGRGADKEELVVLPCELILRQSVKF